MFEIIGEFDYNNYIGDLMTLEEFMKLNEEGYIVPSDGVIGAVIINGKIVNVKVSGWCMFAKENAVTIDLDNLVGLKVKVEIVWCNV